MACESVLAVMRTRRLHAVVDHVRHRVATAAADADDLDDGVAP